MHNYSLLMHSPFFGAGLGGIIIVAALWSLAWKGWALWLAARRGEKIWFIVLLLINTVGILEIIYIFGVAKQKLGDITKEEHKHHDHDHAHAVHDHAHGDGHKHE